VIVTVEQFSTAVEGTLRHSRIQTTLDLHIQEDSGEAPAAGTIPASARDSIGGRAMKMWAGLLPKVFRLLASDRLNGRHEETRKGCDHPGTISSLITRHLRLWEPM
jgi:hypothetical protein